MSILSSNGKVLRVVSGGGGGGNENFKFLYMGTSTVNADEMVGIITQDDCFEFVCTASGKYCVGGIQPSIPLISIDDLETIEACLNMHFVPQTRTNRADIFATAFDITTGVAGPRWVNARYLNASNELYLFSDLSGFSGSTSKSSPGIKNSDVTLKLIYNKSTSRMTLSKLGASGWTIGVNTNNSKLAGMSLGVSFGANLFEGWPFKNGTKIFKAGTYVKYNGELVWGKEV